jgi:hypothetical protein
VLRRGGNDCAYRHGVGDGRGCTYADAHRIAHERSIRRVVDADLEFDERNELYRVRRLDRDESDLRHTEHRRAVRQWDLYADVHWSRRIDRSDCIGIGYIAGSDGFVVGLTCERSIRFSVAADMEHDECDELRCDRRVDRRQRNLGDSNYRGVNEQLEFHVDLLRGGRHCCSDSVGSCNGGHPNSKPVGESARCHAKRFLDVELEQRQRHRVHGLRRLVGDTTPERISHRWTNCAGFDVLVELLGNCWQCSCDDHGFAARSCVDVASTDEER